MFEELKNEHENLKNLLKEKQVHLESYKKEQEVFQQKIKEKDTRIKILEALGLSEENIKERERNLEIEILKNELKYSNQSKNDIYNLASIVFKNPSKVTEINKQHPYEYHNYNYDGKITGSGSCTLDTKETHIERDE